MFIVREFVSTILAILVLAVVVVFAGGCTQVVDIDHIEQKYGTVRETTCTIQTLVTDSFQVEVINTSKGYQILNAHRK